MKVWIVLSSAYEAQCGTTVEVKHVCATEELAKQRLREISTWREYATDLRETEHSIYGRCGNWFYNNDIEAHEVEAPEEKPCK